jgi:antitoxin YefM
MLPIFRIKGTIDPSRDGDKEKRKPPVPHERFTMSTATLDISEARRDFSRLPERLREQQVIWVTRHNKKAFAVVDMDLMETVLETLEILKDPDALKMLHDSLEDIRAGRLIDHEDIGEALNREESDGHSNHDPVDKNGPGSPRKATKRRKERALQ